MRIVLTLGRKASQSKTSDYERALLEAGFQRDEVVRAAPGTTPNGSFDGLVLGGGADVDPARYGQKPRPDADLELDPERDATEFSLFERAWGEKKPILAICRGLQVANVALRGTLVQDLPSEKPSPIVHSRAGEKSTTRREHPVSIIPGTRLAQVAEVPQIEVNSRHHQAILAAAPGLRVSAQAPDGVIEAVEWDRSDRWLLAVQWHPENLAGDPVSRRLFAEFARAVKERSQNFGISD
jgi:putative glutamine amidotransferase